MAAITWENGIQCEEWGCGKSGLNEVLLVGIRNKNPAGRDEEGIPLEDNGRQKNLIERRSLEPIKDTIRGS